jgi:hypothetical protein
VRYTIIISDDFSKKLKKMTKKYRSLPDDYEIFIKNLHVNPTMGTDLGNNTRKVRMAIASKGKGKSGGARVITCNVLVSITNTDIYLLTIYDKSQQESISTQEIEHLKRINGILE